MGISTHPSVIRMESEIEMLDQIITEKESVIQGLNKTIAQMKAGSNDLIESNLDNLDLFNDNSTN